MLVDIYQEDSELGKIPSSQTSSIKVQGDFSNPFRFTIFSTLPLCACSLGVSIASKVLLRNITKGLVRWMPYLGLRSV